MNITVTPSAFYNGFDYFCPVCTDFFSVSKSGGVSYCPSCGMDGLIRDCRELSRWCMDEDIDAAAYWHAFPPNELIPGSCLPVTPRTLGDVFLRGTAASEELIEILRALGIPDFDPASGGFLKSRRETV